MIIDSKSDIKIYCQCGRELTIKTIRFRKPGLKKLSSYQDMGDEIIIVPYYCEVCHKPNVDMDEFKV